MDEMETEQKFKVGDMVVPVKLDEHSVSSMREFIGQAGRIMQFDIDFGYKVHGQWWLPDSIESVNGHMKQPDLHTQLIEKVKDLLFLVAGTEAGESETVKDINDLIYKIQNEKK